VADKEFAVATWSEQYPDAGETPQYAMPEPLGKMVKITAFCDASHADRLVTRRSTTGIFIFVNSTPIQWYSKRYNTVENSTYGSEFVAMRITTEMLLALRTQIRMLSVPLDGVAVLLCDNMSVVMSSTVPGSVPNKKHNDVNYHRVHETIVAQAMQVCHKPTGSNLADILSKILDGPSHRRLISHILR
jgi:hypothetical protein